MESVDPENTHVFTKSLLDEYVCYICGKPENHTIHNHKQSEEEFFTTAAVAAEPEPAEATSAKPPRYPSTKPKQPKQPKQSKQSKNRRKRTKNRNKQD